MTETLAELGTLLAKGGFVAGPLVVGALLLWFALGYRAVMLYAMDRRPAVVLVRAAREGTLRAHGPVARAAIEGYRMVRSAPPHLSRLLEEAHHEYADELGRLRRLASSIVKIAPLLGLLGTVAGMISTFDSLGGTNGLDQGAGVAGGISEALFSTQMGLLVAIPGLLIGRLLERRQSLVEDELLKLREILAREEAV